MARTLDLGRVRDRHARTGGAPPAASTLASVMSSLTETSHGRVAPGVARRRSLAAAQPRLESCVSTESRRRWDTC